MARDRRRADASLYRLAARESPTAPGAARELATYCLRMATAAAGIAEQPMRRRGRAGVDMRWARAGGAHGPPPHHEISFSRSPEQSMSTTYEYQNVVSRAATPSCHDVADVSMIDFWPFFLTPR